MNKHDSMQYQIRDPKGFANMLDRDVDRSFIMKNDILLKYRMLNAEEVNREIFKDFILDLQAISVEKMIVE